MPEPLITQVGARIMSLNDPTKKMSKSEHNSKGTIYLKDDAATIRKKIMSAKTDTLNNVKFDVENQPGISNLLTIYAALKDISIQAAEEECAGLQYGTFKGKVADVIIATLTPIQSRYQAVIDSPQLAQTLQDGAQKARIGATQTLRDVQKAMGLELF